MTLCPLDTFRPPGAIVEETGYPSQTTEEGPHYSACLQPLHNMLMPTFFGRNDTLILRERAPVFH